MTTRLSPPSPWRPLRRARRKSPWSRRCQCTRPRTRYPGRLRSPHPRCPPLLRLRAAGDSPRPRHGGTALQTSQAFSSLSFRGASQPALRATGWTTGSNPPWSAAASPATQPVRPNLLQRKSRSAQPGSGHAGRAVPASPPANAMRPPWSPARPLCPSMDKALDKLVICD